MINNKDYEVIQGKKPILLSAPHVFSHKRPSLSSKYRQGECWTDYIVKNTSLESKSHGIVALKKLEYDPNYHIIEKNPYKKTIEEIVLRNQIKCFFDIHGLSNEHQYDFGIYFLKQYTKSKKIAYQLAEALNKGGLRNCLIQILNIQEGKQKTLTEFVSSDLKVPSIQIEISRDIREKDNLRESLIKNFSEFLPTLIVDL